MACSVSSICVHSEGVWAVVGSVSIVIVNEA